MKRQRFLLLAGVTLAVVVLVLSLAWRQGGQFRDSDGAPVLAGLEAKINDVDQIVISTHDGAAVTLERGESRWTIAELDGYPVDWPVLRKVLTELAQMKIAETKTANPAYFSRLGLEDLSEPDAPGLRIDIRAGEESWSVIVGKEADLQDGHYVRVSDAEQALLADRNLEILLEPGRAIAGNAGVLLTRVEYIKPTSVHRFAIVDAAMNDLMRPALYDAWQDIVPVHRNSEHPEHTYDIVGPVCETGDFLGKNRKLRLQPHDLLAVRSAGAYGFTMSSNYNSRPSPAEVMVSGDQAYLVGARQQLHDLWSGEQLLPPLAKTCPA